MTRHYPHLKRLLRDAGERQADLARLLGRDRAVITHLFSGARKLQTDEVEKIAAHYGVTSDFVLYGTEPTKSSEALAQEDAELGRALKTILRYIKENL